MIDWELASVDYWVSIDGKKPFPVTFYRKQKEWQHDIHTPKALTELQQIEMTSFLKDRRGDLEHIWRQNMKTRLKWPAIESIPNESL